MDESLQELEAELKSLQLQRPAAHLLDRIGRDLAAPGDEPAATALPRYTTATNLRSWKWLGWRTTGLAAALALVVALSLVNFKQPVSRDKSAATQPVRLAVASPAVQTQSVSPARHDRYQPVAASNVLYDLKDEGPAYVDGDTPARRMRYRYLDTYTWKNPRGNASLKWSVPRDEICVLPVSMN